jgi:hypothetical protein
VTKLPADSVESVAAVLGRWWDRTSQVADSTYARGAMKANLLGNLRRGDLSTVPRVYIERMARAGHEPAQEALRLYIAEAVDNHTFQDLPGGFQTFARDFLLNGMPDCERLPGYGRGNKIIDTWTRDVMISFFLNAAIERWKFKKKQAAAIMAIMLKRRGVKVSSTRQVLDIYNRRDTLGRRVVEFMLAEIPDDEAAPPPSPA